jgi:TRAP-type C4-dicarboxylate transport system permease large subunit
MAGVILLLIGTSAPFSWLINIMDLPDQISAIMLAMTSNKYILLIIILVFLLLMGTIMDATANILIFGPILAPLAVNAGFHPIHFALLMVMALIIGVGTPPVGSCLFAVVPLSKASLEEISVAIMPFFLAQAFILFLCAFVPIIVMWIPSLLGYL